MKKLYIILAVVTTTISHFSSYAQDSIPTFKENEVKINLARSIFEQFLEGSYERVLIEDLGVGANIGFNINGDSADSGPYIFQFIPYTNWYFNGKPTHKKFGSGFFLQANMGINTTRTITDYDYGHNSEKKYPSKTLFGIGMGLGWKFVSRNNWLALISFAGGRNLTNAENGFETGYFHYTISIGKRF